MIKTIGGKCSYYAYSIEKYLPRDSLLVPGKDPQPHVMIGKYSRRKMKPPHSKLCPNNLIRHAALVFVKKVIF